MFRLMATGIALALVACSNDTFVDGDAGTDAGDDHAAVVDSGPPPDVIVVTEAGGADGGCTSSAAPACSGGCASLQSCCVKGTGSTCNDTTCLGGETLACLSSADCKGSPSGFTCCLTQISSLNGCPTVAKSSNGNSLATKCGNACTGNDRQVCKLGSNDCTNGTCIPVLLDINASVEIGVCN